MICSDCGRDMDPEPWWDDAEENGGQCIGTVYVCHCPGNPDCCPNGVEYF